MTSNGALKHLVQMFALMAAYAALSYIGLAWAEADRAGSPVWPAAGVGLAGLMLGGIRLWPAIFFGRLIAGALTNSPHSFLVEVLISAANAISDVIPTYILARQHVSLELPTLRDMVKYLGYGAALGPAICAAIGVASLAPSAGLSFERTIGAFWFWLVGSFVGTTTIGPLIQSWAGKLKPEKFERGEFVRVGLPVIAVAVASWIIFNQPQMSYLRSWHILPFIVWAALTSRLSATASLAVMSFIAIWGDKHGAAIFAGPGKSPADQIILLQQFIAVISVTTLCLSAVADERAQTSGTNLRLALEGADQGSFAYDVKDNKVLWDERTCDLFGVSRDEKAVTIERMQSLVHVNDRLAVKSAILHTLNPLGDGVYDVQHRIDTPDGSVRWVAVRGQTTFVGQGFRRRPASTRGVVRDITVEKAAIERQQLLAKEIIHRARNQLAVIQSLTSRSLTGDMSLEQGRKALLDRLHAMSGAFGLLDEALESAALVDVIEHELERFGGRYTVSGPNVKLKSEVVQTFGLLIHELATNASKYGSLSHDGGVIEIQWTVSGDVFDYRWQETNRHPGASAGAPSRTGFGTTLIDVVVPSQLLGKATRQYTHPGFVYTLTCPLSQVGHITGNADVSSTGRPAHRSA